MGERSLGTRANFADIVGAGSIVIGLIIVLSGAAAVKRTQTFSKSQHT